MDSKRNRTVIVTGSGRGIGRGIALLMGKHDYNVVVATRTASHGESTVSMISDAGGEACLHVTSLESRQATEKMVGYAFEQYGAVDVVVHNAAHAVIEMLEDLTDETINKTLDVNIKAGIWMTQAVLPHMKAQGGGRILFTSSVTAQRAIPGATAYAISKAGLHGFIRNAALELGKYNITVNGVEPGVIQTDALKKHNFTDVDIRRFNACIPLNRFGKPEDIAGAMLYLAGEGAGYITGQTIVVDGGMLLPETGAMMIRD